MEAEQGLIREILEQEEWESLKGVLVKSRGKRGMWGKREGQNGEDKEGRGERVREEEEGSKWRREKERLLTERREKEGPQVRWKEGWPQPRRGEKG